MEMLLVALAGVGLIMMILGRHMMIRDTGGDLSFFWILMLRLVPLSDMLYMVRHYAQAKTGGIVSVIGMWLMVPYFGNMLWEREEHLKAVVAEMAQKHRGRDSQDLSVEARNDMSAEAIIAISRWKSEHLAEKTRKVDGLNAHLKTWYEQLQAERAKLNSDPGVVQKFNENVAAYSAFNAVAKEENAELAELQRR
jgi:hypothetical protein